MEPSQFRGATGEADVQINLVYLIVRPSLFFQSYFVTYERFVQWLDWLQDQNNTRWTNKKGTVGAVAVDASGRTEFVQRCSRKLQFSLIGWLDSSMS